MAEILVAGALLAGVVAVTLRVFMNASLLSSTSTVRTEANSLAQWKLEELHEMVRQDWWTLVSMPLYCSPSAPSTYSESVSINGKNYTRNYTVSPVTTASPDQDYRKVVMTVTEQ